MKSLHFLYHELRPVPTEYSYVTKDTDFDQHCALFARVQRAGGEHLYPEITFDDGHSSDYQIALPILERHGLQAKFFITVGWSGQRAGFMNWTELRGLQAAGHGVGAHGWTHKLLVHCTQGELHQELVESRQRLEDGLGTAVTVMSLPGGRANPRVLQACWQAGYKKVFTSVPQAAESSTQAEQTIVGRVNVRNGVTLAWMEEVLRPQSGLLAGLERQDRLKRGAKIILGDQLYARVWGLLNRSEPEVNPKVVSE